jgi:hypothetical protein
VNRNNYGLIWMLAGFAFTAIMYALVLAGVIRF